MSDIVGTKNPKADLFKQVGIKNTKAQYWNLTPDELTEQTIQRGQGVLSDKGALVIETGEFTGRSPQDRFIVKDKLTADLVDWGNINCPFDTNDFNKLYDKVVRYFEYKDVFVRDMYACAHKSYKLGIRLVSEYPWSNMFASNMFLRYDQTSIQTAVPDWTILCAPGFMADPQIDGTRQHNFSIINFSNKCIIIGGTGYTGEIKKGIFSVLNFVLPTERNVLPMHCSANIGKDKDTALFFGLSGTGKTTLSADASRGLIGDDEHGWTENAVFNFEGGCYAKVIDLSKEKEPEIYAAIRKGAILENIVFKKGTNIPDYTDDSKTQNTRVSYPIEHIDNAVYPSVGGEPKNIFFLTYDAFGVLPPISRLSKAQAMYQFISGYTSKVAGTEAGITEPQTAFSSCYGAPFLPLHPTKYASMLGDKIDKTQAKVWLVNTGMTGGAYGEGKRMSLKHTRALVKAALEGHLDQVSYTSHAIFGVEIPTSCAGVPSEILSPRNTWKDKEAYDKKAKQLSRAFVQNFEKFEEQASAEIRSAAPITD